MARILVIDESLTLRMVLKDLLESAGHTPMLCVDLDSARRQLAAAPFDLIVLDASLLDANASQFLRQLRSDPVTATVPLLLLREEGQCTTCAANATAPEVCLPKPYDPAELQVQVDRLLGTRHPPKPPLRMTILAVDDSPTYLHMLEEHLRQDGHEVLLATSGPEALRLLALQPVDCVLMDLTMPGLSGQETCRRIKHNPAFRSIPILMLTGREDREAMLGSFNAGADDFISKSSELEVLKARLRVHLHRRRSEQENRLMREQLHHKEIEAAEARANRELAETRAALLTDLERKNALLQQSQRELVRAKEAAEAANRAKDQFLAVLSHELRTPLTPVLATASLLERRRDLPPDLCQDIQTIRRNVELEARIIDDLLDLTRIARGKMTFQMRPTDLHQLIASAADICRHGEGAPIVLELEASAHTVHGDPARLQQMLWNLLNNARKFTPHDGRIVVRTRNAQKAGGMGERGNWRGGDKETRGQGDKKTGDAANCQLPTGNWQLATSSIETRKSKIENLPHSALFIEITDTGVGIEPQLLPRIFGAFEQGELGPGRRLGGLGLGLAISKAIVQAHQGAISAASPGPGQGATFTIELPTTSAAPEPHLPSPAPPQQPPPHAPRTLKILLVEDRDASLKAMARLIESMGHRVRTATDVRSALQSAADGGFDLVVSDLGLPDGTGHQLMEQLRAQYGLRGIAVSGYGMEEDIRKSRAAGFIEHLVKPIDVTALENAISRATCSPATPRPEPR